MNERTCTAPECDRAGRLKLGMCGKHYQRHVKYGSSDLPTRSTPTCEGPRCSRAAGASRLCRSHYKQSHLGKPLTPLLVSTKDLGRPTYCSFPGCERPHKARGLCKSHNEQASKGQDLRAVNARQPGLLCSEGGCSEANLARGLCSRHLQANYDAVRRWGLTIDQYEEMRRTQGDACAICGGTNPNGYRLSVDHDHTCCPGNYSCGQCVRGLLCSGCNLAIGHAGDSAGRLRRAADYLDQNNARAVMRAG